MNKVIIIGNLTRDPELSKTNTGKNVCHLTVAVSDGFGDKKETNYFNVESWGAQGESCAKYLTKGSKVGVCGRLRTRTYEKKDGAKATVIEIVASDIDFLSSKGETETKSKEPYQPTLDEIDDKDLPF